MPVHEADLIVAMSDELTELTADLTLRTCTAEDTSFLQALLFQRHATAFSRLPVAIATELANMQIRGQRLQYDAEWPDRAQTLILRAGQPVGRFDFAALAGRLHLIDLVIAANARGQGIGGAVLTAAIRAARSFDLGAVTLCVAAPNEAAQRLYRRLKFTPDATGAAPDGTPAITLGMTRLTSI